MPINVETLFQKGGYTAGGVSSSSGASSDPLGPAKLAIQKEQLELDKKRLALDEEKTRRPIEQEELLGNTVAKYTETSPDGGFKTDHTKVIGELTATGNSSLAQKYKEELSKDLTRDVEEFKFLQTKSDRASELQLRAFEQLEAGANREAADSLTEALFLSGVQLKESPTIQKADTPGNVIIKVNGQEEKINIKNYTKSLVSANVKWQTDAYKEMANDKDSASNVPLHVRQYLASTKGALWRKRLEEGEEPEQIAADIGYITEPELADMAEQRGITSPSKWLTSAASNPNLADQFSASGPLPSIVKMANEMYNTGIRSMLGAGTSPGSYYPGLDPSIRKKYSVPRPVTAAPKK